jgi:uncharacterized protein YgiM (DUF1202 family)
MLKKLLPGLLIGGAVTLSLSGFALQIVNAQTPSDVSIACPQQPAGVSGVEFDELVAYSSNHHRSAWVSSREANVRRGHGFAPVDRTLPRGAKVLVTGEAWDSACNRWMQVRIDNGSYWMHGSTLAFATPATGEGPPMGSGSQAAPLSTPPPADSNFIQDRCPRTQQYSWTEGYELYEIIDTIPDQTVQVIKDNSELRENPGQSHRVVGQLDQGQRVIKLGEAWDNGCKQWIQVRFNGNEYWMDGHTLQ